MATFKSEEEKILANLQSEIDFGYGGEGGDGRVSCLKISTPLHNIVPVHSEAICRITSSKVRDLTGFQSITIIGDSKIVIKKCNSTATDKSVIEVVIQYIQRKKQFFQESHFQFIHRSENRQAHELATEALKTGEETYLEDVAFICLQRGREERWLRNPD
ncbi:hypothetical protein PVK06_044824 [Gossypium arboreum]|uniref:RNase H type-1 domain-containing protein n=1 Tax=Gossypium arboreum TaxID=29729 RepID=A0ABR0MSC2_GOSAR|nr:hypothetical protein PVK06_044824 [Gossypium arboreum]